MTVCNGPVDRKANQAMITTAKGLAEITKLIVVFAASAFIGGILKQSHLETFFLRVFETTSNSLEAR